MCYLIRFYQNPHFRNKKKFCNKRQKNQDFFPLLIALISYEFLATRIPNEKQTACEDCPGNQMANRLTGKCFCPGVLVLNDVTNNCKYSQNFTLKPIQLNFTFKWAC